MKWCGIDRLLGVELNQSQGLKQALKSGLPTSNSQHTKKRKKEANPFALPCGESSHSWEWNLWHLPISRSFLEGCRGDNEASWAAGAQGGWRPPLFPLFEQLKCNSSLFIAKASHSCLSGLHRSTTAVSHEPAKYDEDKKKKTFKERCETVLLKRRGRNYIELCYCRLSQYERNAFFNFERWTRDFAFAGNPCYFAICTNCFEKCTYRFANVENDSHQTTETNCIRRTCKYFPEQSQIGLDALPPSLK